MSSRIRRSLREIHRDAGYLAVGLTFVYAISGIAVNHIADWDPNFRNIEESVQLPKEIKLKFSPTDRAQNEAAARKVLHILAIDESPEEVYAASSTELDITLPSMDIHVDTQVGRIVRTGQEERWLLKTANFLHLNRGKQAWTYIADGYAGLLLVLATSGLFVVKGRLGLFGRGGLFFLIGALVPITYVILS